MRRTLLLTLLMLLAFTPAAYAQDDLSIEILRDCVEDDILQGDYSASEMRKAIEAMPAELDEYAPCRDILSREIAAKIAASNPAPAEDTDTPTDDGAAGSGGSSGTDPSPSATAAPATTSAPTGRDPGIRIGPSTPEDWKAMEGANRYAKVQPIVIDGRPVTPVAAVGRNSLPGTVVAVLALLAAAAVAGGVSRARR